MTRESSVVTLMKVGIRWAAALALFLLVGAVTCAAQEVSATMYGTVTDPAGAAVPDASITITNPATGYTVTAKTGGDGSYLVTALPIGTYTLTVEHAGFEKSVQTGIKLDVFQRAKVDPQLRVGAITTTVEVASSAPLVETATATISAVIDARKIVELPLNIRRFGTLPLLMPGTVMDRGGFSSTAFGSPFSEDTYAANGARGSGNNFLIDGVDSKNYFTGAFSVQPSPDAIEEFKIQTQSFSAVFGKNSGSTINLVTKSGKNEIHGTVFEFIRNDKLDARNFFDYNQVGPSGEEIPGSARGHFRRNQFGGYMGGPIIKNKTFWFAGYEGLRRRKGLSNNGLVPTALMREGNFSELLEQDDPGLEGEQPWQIIDPTSCSSPPYGSGCEPFEYNGQLNVIPPDRLETVVAPKILAALPLPNHPGTDFNYVLTPLDVRNDHQFQARVDHTFGPKDNLFVRYILGHSLTVGATGYTFLPGFEDKTRYRGQNIALGWTHTVSPTMLNEFRFGFSRNMDVGLCNACPRDPGFVESFGIEGLKASSASDEGWPFFGFGQGYVGVGDSLYRPVESNDMVEKYYDALTITKGKHTLVMGVDYQPYQALRVQSPYAPRGWLEYVGNYSNHTMSDFLLGYPSHAVRTVRSAVHNQDGKFWSFFFQDDWRATKNLTFNIGLRYEYHQLPTDRRDIAGILFPVPGAGLQKFGNAFLVVPGYAQADAFCSDPQYNLAPGDPTPDAPERHLVMCSSDMKQYGFTGRSERSLSFPDRFNWAPRFGFAWQPTGSNRLVFRGGYGLFFELSQFNGFHYGSNNPIQSPSQDTFFDTEVQPTVTTQTAFIGGENIPLKDAFLSLDADANFKQPYVHQWSFGVQSELSSNTALEVRYVGSSAVQMSHFHFFGNQPFPGLGEAQLRRPYPDFGNTVTMSSGANAHYNSLQVQLTRKMSQGLSFLSGYTWAKQISNNEGEEGAYADWPGNLTQNDNNQGEERGRGVNDVRQRFTIGYMYELPFGQGKRWAAQGGALNTLVGDWKLTGGVSFQTGFPSTISTGIDVANTGITGWRPDRTCRGDLPASQRSIDRWFDESCFTIGSPYAPPNPNTGDPGQAGSGLLREITLCEVSGYDADGNPICDIYTGNPRFGNSGRNILDGPGIKTLDLALLKDFRLSEKLRLQFRAEFFNAFNHAVFNDPVNDISDDNFGKVFGTRSDPRDIQFALKLLW